MRKYIIVGITVILGLILNRNNPKTLNSSSLNTTLKERQILSTSILKEKTEKLFPDLPISFVENKGQWDQNIKFLAKRKEMTAQFEKDAIILSLVKGRKEDKLSGVVVRLKFEGASDKTQIEGQTISATTHNYFIGNDPKKWQQNVPTYQSIVYKNIYDEIDLKVRESNKNLEYDLLAKPNADLSKIRIHAEGVQKMHLGSDGSLIMQTALGDIKQHPPKTWYKLASGEKQEVKANFRIIDHSHYSFEVPNRNPELALVIDPGLEWSTFYGGDDFENVQGMTITPNGEILIAGVTRSPNLPMITGQGFDTTMNASWPDTNGFIAKFDPTGSQLIWATFLGTRNPIFSDWGTEGIYALGLNRWGEIIVAGSAGAATFPTTPNAFDTIYNQLPHYPPNTGSSDLNNGFIAKFNANGNQLLYSTFLGRGVGVRNLSVDYNSGVVTVIGKTADYNFPITTNAYDNVNLPPITGGWYGYDGFLTKLIPDTSISPNQQLIYSTYFGGSVHDTIIGLDINNQIVTIVGYTDSIDFPTTLTAYDTQLAQGNCSTLPFTAICVDGYVAQLDLGRLGSSQLIYSTFLGGTGDGVDNGGLDPQGDSVYAVSVSPSGIISVAGYTNSLDFPVTSNAYDTQYNDDVYYGYHADVFISQLDPTKIGQAQLVYSTFIGGARSDVPQTLVQNRAGIIIVSGATKSYNFPTTNGAYDRDYGQYGDAFILKIRPSSPPDQQLIYSTFLGGTLPPYGGFTQFPEIITAQFLDKNGSLIIAGLSDSADFPTTSNAFQPQCANINFGKCYTCDGIIAKLDLLPTGVNKYGTSSRSVNHKIRLIGGTSDVSSYYIASDVNKMPQTTDATFKITSTGAPANATGTLYISSGQDLIGTHSNNGIITYINFNQLVDAKPVQSDSLGYVEAVVSLASMAQGTQIFTQFIWNDPAISNGQIASNALDITVQP